MVYPACGWQLQSLPRTENLRSRTYARVRLHDPAGLPRESDRRIVLPEIGSCAALQAGLLWFPSRFPCDRAACSGSQALGILLVGMTGGLTTIWASILDLIFTRSAAGFA